jgi:hypothetical protein
MKVSRIEVDETLAEMAIHLTGVLQVMFAQAL